MIIIFRAIQGAGKTTLINYLLGKPVGSGVYNHMDHPALMAEFGMLSTKLTMLPGGNISVLSTDNFFMVNGEYRFDPALLSQAHAECLESFTKRLVAIDKGDDTNRHVLFVDNTNTTIAEVAPYAQLACAFGHELHIFTLLADPLLAWRRNCHGVPLTNVVKAHLALEQSIRDWPAWWPQKIFPVV